MSHHVITPLPDGRVIRADYRLPVVAVQRRIHAELEKPAGKRDYDRLERLGLEAAAWLDEHPKLNCTADQVLHDTCSSHGPVV